MVPSVRSEGKQRSGEDKEPFTKCTKFGGKEKGPERKAMELEIDKRAISTPGCSDAGVLCSMTWRAQKDTIFQRGVIMSGAMSAYPVSRSASLTRQDDRIGFPGPDMPSRPDDTLGCLGANPAWTHMRHGVLLDSYVAAIPIANHCRYFTRLDTLQAHLA